MKVITAKTLNIDKGLRKKVNKNFQEILIDKMRSLRRFEKAIIDLFKDKMINELSIDEI